MEQDGLLVRQRYLGNRGFVILIAFLSAFIPLSTDVYLPALPKMVKSFHSTPSNINLTLIFFFVFYALGTMFWGPLSDKYGRKRILLTGLIIYTIASVLCVFSVSVIQLILYRILQAVGCGAATAVSTAIVKDVYSGKKRLKIIALVQSMGMVSPIVSPVLGAVILTVFSWRGVFVVLSIIGVLAVAGTLAMEETIGKYYDGSIFKAIGRLGAVAGNKGFRTLLLTFSMMSIPSMSFITGSSYIFVTGFGLSESVYSYYFAANAVFFLIGPLVYIRISGKISSRVIITAVYVVSLCSGLLLCGIGSLKPWIFELCIIPTSLMGSVMGPPRTNMMLDQLSGDTGAASSLMSCAYTFFGSIGMFLISQKFSNRILVMGVMYVVVSALSLAVWINVNGKPYIKQDNTHLSAE